MPAENPATVPPAEPEPLGPCVTEKLFCGVCHAEVENPPKPKSPCPHCPHKHYHIGLLFMGSPGKIWINNTEDLVYQLTAAFDHSCGSCLQYASRIHFGGWGIPFHRGCLCRQTVILPGSPSLPFVDFLCQMRRMNLDQQHAVMGRCNWILFSSGIVGWSDIVTPYRVREFHEVMDTKRLSVPDMVKAGVPENDAKAAWELVYTPERLARDAERREALHKLRGLGLSTEDIAKAASIGLAGRIARPHGSKGQSGK